MSIIGWLAVPMVVAGLGLLAYYWPRTPTGPSVWDIAAELPHRAPDTTLTLAQAHRAAYEHRRCRLENCRRRRAALRVLIAAGRIEPTDHLHQVLYEQFGNENS